MLWAGLGCGAGLGLATEQVQGKAPKGSGIKRMAESGVWGRGPSEGCWEDPVAGLRVSEVKEGSGGTWILRREVWV